MQFAAQVAVDPRGPRPGRGPPARPLPAARPHRRPRGLGRRRLPRRRPRAARGRARPPASAAPSPCSTSGTSMREKGPRRVSPHTIPMLMPNGPAAVVGLELGARAGVHTPVSACASGAEAIALGLEMIRSGRADVVVAGGTEACIHPLPLAAFAAMMALSQAQRRARAAPPVRGTTAATASSSARARPSWSWSPPSTPRPAVHASTARSPEPASPPTATTSPSRTPRAGAPPGRCARRWPTPGLQPQRHRARQRARHLDPAGRPGGGRWRSGTAFGDARAASARDVHQVDDRPPARRGRRPRVDRYGPGAVAPAWCRRRSTSTTSTTRSASTS